jgi:hypothetical protein
LTRFLVVFNWRSIGICTGSMAEGDSSILPRNIYTDWIHPTDLSKFALETHGETKNRTYLPFTKVDNSTLKTSASKVSLTLSPAIGRRRSVFEFRFAAPYIDLHGLTFCIHCPPQFDCIHDKFNCLFL